jgi:hypothetical protein
VLVHHHHAPLPLHVAVEDHGAVRLGLPRPCRSAYVLYASFACACLAWRASVPNCVGQDKEHFMNTKFIALAVATTLGLGSVSAFAQDYRHERRAQGGWQQQQQRQDHRWEQQQRRDGWAQNNRYYAPPAYAYRDNRWDNRRDDGDVVGALVLGALAGAVIGQVANNNSYNSYNTYNPGYYNPGYGYSY